MTLKELKGEVYSLARLPISQHDPLFSRALRLALTRLRTELMITEEKRIYVRPRRPTVSIPAFIHRSGEEKTLPLSGRAYSLLVSGKGHFTVKDGGDSLRYDFDSDGERFCGFIKKGGEICFGGNFTYTVLDYVCFEDITSDRTSDIPDGECRIGIDLASEGILRVVSVPTDEYGRPIDGIGAVGDRLILPPRFSGTVRLEIIRIPRECVSDEDTVDLPTGYTPLLAPLVASLLFIDDDPELSEKCGKIYENMRKELNPSTKPSSPAKVQTNGWA